LTKDVRAVLEPNTGSRIRVSGYQSCSGAQEEEQRELEERELQDENGRRLDGGRDGT
jgi:hypothetical protein